jgi:Sec-independent protein translocase protein TatA
MGEGLFQPLLGKGMGQAIRGFKESMKDGGDDATKDSTDKPKEPKE